MLLDAGERLRPEVVHHELADRAVGRALPRAGAPFAPRRADAADEDQRGVGGRARRRPPFRRPGCRGSGCLLGDGVADPLHVMVEACPAPRLLRRAHSDRAAFIRANTLLKPVPFVPELQLHLADEAMALWELTEADLGRLDLPPPFWAFAWAGGQALARFVLDAPALGRRPPRPGFRSRIGPLRPGRGKAGARSSRRPTSTVTPPRPSD